MTSTRAGVPSAWSPLRHKTFRLAWLAFLGVQLMQWAQTVGAVDVIAQRSSSATLIALVQTATSLPAVALALPAGAIADLVDRRSLLAGLIAAMAAAMAALAALVFADVASPAAVLALTFVLGAAIAVAVPAFASLTPELVPRGELAGAVTLTGISINLARAAGPALAGAVIALSGAGVLFAVQAATLAAVVLLVAGALPRSMPRDDERFGDALRAGLRYARFSAPLRAVLARAACFILPASALWSLLPVVSIGRLGLGSSGFGVLLAVVGAGAVLGAQLLPLGRARLGFDRLVAVGTAYTAVALAALALVPGAAPAAAVLLFAGAAWIAVLSSVNTAAQLAAPAWVRGRVLAFNQLIFAAGMAAGSLAWGVLAEQAGIEAALLVAAGAVAVGLPAGLRWRLGAPAAEDLAPALLWPEPILVDELEDDAGPVLVTVEYEVADADVEELVAVLHELAAVRRRDGAFRWRLYRDPAQPRRFVEAFEIGSWREHLLQHERLPRGDEALVRRAAELGGGGTPPVVRHLIDVPRRGIG